MLFPNIGSADGFSVTMHVTYGLSFDCALYERPSYYKRLHTSYVLEIKKKNKIEMSNF